MNYMGSDDLTEVQKKLAVKHGKYFDGARSYIAEMYVSESLSQDILTLKNLLSISDGAFTRSNGETVDAIKNNYQMMMLMFEKYQSYDGVDPITPDIKNKQKIISVLYQELSDKVIRVLEKPVNVTQTYKFSDVTSSAYDDDGNIYRKKELKASDLVSPEEMAKYNLSLDLTPAEKPNDTTYQPQTTVNQTTPIELNNIEQSSNIKKYIIYGGVGLTAILLLTRKK